MKRASRKRARFGEGRFDIRQSVSWELLVAGQAILVLMLLGGPTPSLPVTVTIAISAIVTLASMPFAGDPARWREQPLVLRAALVGIALLPLLQLVPMPPDLWHALPGQEVRIRVLAIAGLADTWQPLSVSPVSTAGSAVVAIAFVALIRLLLSLSAEQLRNLAWLVLGVVALNILIGLVQVASGGQALLFYSASDKGAFLGFYANKNHAALVLTASLPIAAYVLGARFHPEGTRTWLALYAGVVLVAIITTNSRAGLVLGLVTAIVLGCLYIRAVKPIYIAAAAAVALIAVIVVSTTSAFETVFSRFDNVDQDLRWQFLQTSWPLIERYWSSGSGLGSFATLYAANEGLAYVKPTYVNQLHNDYAQLLLEAGVAGVALLAVLVAGLVQRGIQLWLDPAARGHRLTFLFGTLIIAAIAFHSAVDYPLRRPAVLPLLAIALVLAARGDLMATTGVSRRKH